MTKEDVQKDIKAFRDYLLEVQEEFEYFQKDEDLQYQTIVIKQRISALLSIYSQMVCEDRKFDKNYLKKYGVRV